MKQLDVECEQAILKKKSEANVLMREKKYNEALTVMLEAWSLFPEPKEGVVMSNVIAEVICKIYLVRLIDYKNAMNWADIIFRYYTIYSANDLGDGEFWKGKVYYEMGNLDEAQKQFRISFQKSEGSGWQEAPQEYIDLLKK
ncbi:tetratricopeptide (TPR) repeat protein [Pedobacter sp. UYP30]|uniref:hypothetical protein n=1 Tax=Pedobacter sp. UYP30 TaxID=1756400 RepID=UPI00339AE811